MAEEKNINNDNLSPIQDEIVLYQSEDGNVKVDVLFQDETVWLTQEQMAQLFGKGRTTITEHIGNIFKEGELDEEKVCRKFRHTTQHGAIEGLLQTQEVKYYNLDVIISVGYRVNASLPMMGLTSTSTLEKVRKQNRNTRNIRKSRRNRTRHPISCSMPRQKPSAR